MTPGIVACSSTASLAEVARVMAIHGVHCVTIVAPDADEVGERRLDSVLSDIDLLAWATGSTPGARACGRGSRPVVTVAPDTSIYDAAELMVGHGIDHLVVVDQRGGSPVGILSALDVAAVLAHGELNATRK